MAHRTIELFWDKVVKTDSCWLWNGSSVWSGYGMHWDGPQNKRVLAHRFSYKLHFGEIPKGMNVCHTCDVKKCVNPSHFFLGTAKDNALDEKRKGLRACGEKIGNSVLSSDDVVSMRRDRVELGMQYKDIGKKYGCSTTCARVACVGTRWSHVPGHESVHSIKYRPRASA